MTQETAKRLIKYFEAKENLTIEEIRLKMLLQLEQMRFPVVWITRDDVWNCEDCDDRPLSDEDMAEIADNLAAIYDCDMQDDINTAYNEFLNSRRK